MERKEITAFIKAIASEIVRDLNDNVEKHETMFILINAHNTWQEADCDGVDYIFSLSNNEDIKTVIDGGLSLQQLFEIYNSHNTTFFLYGVNHPKPAVFGNADELREYLSMNVEIIVRHMLAYPNSYSELYRRYITDSVTI